MIKEFNYSSEEELFKAIERGVFRDMYLIYNRKSLDEADSQKNSLKYQRHHNSRHARDMKLPVALITVEGFCRDGVISEKHSGYKEKEELVTTEGGLVQFQIQRPKFQRLVHYLNSGYFKGVVCLCWDRISRNKSDNTVVRKLMKQGVDEITRQGQCSAWCGARGKGLMHKATHACDTHTQTHTHTCTHAHTHTHTHTNAHTHTNTDRM
jgi:hypothetical protein